MTLRQRWKKGDRFLVRHLDDAVLVVEKPAGLLTHSTPNKRGENLLDLLRAFAASRGPHRKVLPIHRLDRAVSGLLVYARKPAAQENLQAQFARHDVERIYLAAVEGVLAEDSGTFESLLKTDHPSLRVFSVDREGRGVRRAVTHWRVVERMRASTLVEVRLETGLRNQIRVHFAEAEHPLLGDRKYGRAEKKARAERIFLHAAVLGFEHPERKRTMRFESALPPDLVQWKKRL